MKIDVIINGENTTIETTDLQQLLENLHLTSRPCATLINGEVVKRDQRAQYQLKDGDSVDIVSMVGGG